MSKGKGWHGPHPKKNALREEVVSLRDQGLTLEEIGALVNLTRERVRQLLKDVGYGRKIVSRKRRHALITFATPKAVIEAIKGGKNLREAAKVLKVSVTHLSQWLVSQDIDATRVRREALIGRKFNDLTVTAIEPEPRPGRVWWATCTCKCGSVWRGDLNNVLRDRTKSCGHRLYQYWQRDIKKRIYLATRGELCKTV